MRSACENWLCRRTLGRGSGDSQWRHSFEHLCGGPGVAPRAADRQVRRSSTSAHAALRLGPRCDRNHSRGGLERFAWRTAPSSVPGWPWGFSHWCWGLQAVQTDPWTRSDARRRRPRSRCASQIDSSAHSPLPAATARARSPSPPGRPPSPISPALFPRARARVRNALVNLAGVRPPCSRAWTASRSGVAPLSPGRPRSAFAGDPLRPAR